MISAFETLNSIEQANRSVRQDEDRLNGVIETTASETARLRTEQAGLYKALAQVRLQALQQDQILGALDGAEQRALAAIDDNKRQLDLLSNRRDALSRELADSRVEREDRSRALGLAANALTALEEETQKQLSGNVDWQGQIARLSGAQDRAQAAEDKARQSEADRDAKSKPYLADALFVYLWNAGYGTPAYRRGPLARLGDGYVARVVNYEPARQNYFALTEIPKRLREHAERLKLETGEEEVKLVALEREALEAAGIARLENEHTAAEDQVKTLDERISRLEQQDTSLERERSELLGGSGLAGAVEDLATSMQREDLRVLLRDALQTPSKEDERIVGRLQEIEADLANLAHQTDEARQASIALARKRAELERSRDEFRRSGYERQGGGFTNDKLIGEVIGGIIGGVLSSRELGDALRSGWQGGGSSSSRPGGSVFGGSQRGGRSQGGSSGGFKTGGGF